MVHLIKIYNNFPRKTKVKIFGDFFAKINNSVSLSLDPADYGSIVIV
jgi:hypothetical protein